MNKSLSEIIRLLEAIKLEADSYRYDTLWEFMYPISRDADKALLEAKKLWHANS
jgi:hypothetical protein